MPLEAYLKGSKGAIASGGKTLLVNRPQGIKTEDEVDPVFLDTGLRDNQ